VWPSPNRNHLVTKVTLTVRVGTETISRVNPIRKTLLLLCAIFAPACTFAQTNLNAPRMFELGMDALMGIGPGRDTVAAMDYFRKSADLGYPPAQISLGYYYETGGLLAVDPAMALDWYKKAAKQDDRVADWVLGRLYFTGQGTPRDLNQAQVVLQRAANQEDPFGAHLLGMVLLERSQYAQAAKWFEKAAMQGLPQAQQQLGMLYKDGKGVTADKLQAYVWMLVSYDSGNTSNTSDILQLQADLGTTQVDQAKAKARDLEQVANRVVNARGCSGWAGEMNTVPAPPPPEIQRFCR
jgi:TPR repeat protein